MEKMRVLVVDDEQGICRNVQKILAKNDYEVSQAQSAEEALEKMATQAFSLLISDIVMPGGKNGLELLRIVKDQWPLTKVVMMTAYASTDTAMKAIRLGALDYIPKPFTPDEVRTVIKRAVDGEVVEASSSRKERQIIDLDVPFDREEVARHTGGEYAGMLGPSDMPVVEVPRREALPNFCSVGEMVCDIYAKLGNTCKAGLKGKGCPQRKAQEKKAAADKGFDRETLIGIDQPFNYEDVVSVTGPEYVRHLEYDGLSYVPYEALKANWSQTLRTAVPAMKTLEAAAKILVIDDEAAVNNNIRRILAKKGYRVEQAMTRADALKKIAEGDYGLVLLDLKMPEVKGLELLRAVRDRNPAAKVIIVTGYASIETAVETARLGAVGYLPKPFTPDEIRQATQTAFLLAA